MNIINYIYDNLNKVLLFAVLYLLIWVVLQVILGGSYATGLLLSLVPLLFLLLVLLLDRPYYSFILLFIVNYFVSGATRYVAYPPGLAMDFLFLLLIIILILQLFRRDKVVSISDAGHPLTLISFFWLLFCIFQVLNPGSSSILAWLINVRGIGVYFFLVVVLASVYLKKLKDVRQIINIWSVLCLIAVLKAFIQNNFGFDPFEQIWLAEGGSRTHIIHTGIRYFSIFTDAGNFGSGIGFSGVVFSILAFSQPKKIYRNYYIFVAIACYYGMIISGTRGSLVIPFAGYFLFAVLSKNTRTIIAVTFFVVTATWFLNFTFIGQGNVYIRRMRSVFNPDDASLLVRLENQRILRTYMAGKPFGVGIGMKRGSAVLYTPHPILSKIPHDSWYVLLWVEVGLVGMALYILLLLYILFHGSYLVMFSLKNKELRGVVAAIVCALFGVSAAAYTLEIFGQFPNSVIIYLLMTVIFISPRLDKELEMSKRI